MKKLTFLLVSAFTIYSLNINAQCSSCTTTITTADATNHFITTGQTLCIAPTGSCSGLITISGGSLCNEGTITSPNIWMTSTSSVFNNYGTITSSNILLDGSSTYNNYGTATIDSLLVTQYSVFNNLLSAQMTNIRLAFTDGGYGANFATITVDYFGDSLASFLNNGNLFINYDFLNGYYSNFQNTAMVQINRDFYNSTGSTFSTGCMIQVGRDWYNSASVNVPITGTAHCGGFMIAGLSLNSGTVGGALSDVVDLCDAAHPVTNIDGNTGTIDPSTTYCNCTNFCPGLLAVNEQKNVFDFIVFPIPATSQLTINVEQFSSGNKQISFEIYDVLGECVYKSEIANPKSLPDRQAGAITIDVSSLPSGIYSLACFGEDNKTAHKLFSIVR